MGFATVTVICVLMVSPWYQEQCPILLGSWCPHRMWLGRRSQASAGRLSSLTSMSLEGSRCHLTALTVIWCNFPQKGQLPHPHLGQFCPQGTLVISGAFVVVMGASGTEEWGQGCYSTCHSAQEASHRE